MSQDEERKKFQEAHALSRPSCVNFELDMRKLSNLRIGESVLGQVYLCAGSFSLHAFLFL